MVGSRQQRNDRKCFSLCLKWISFWNVIEHVAEECKTMFRDEKLKEKFCFIYLAECYEFLINFFKVLNFLSYSRWVLFWFGVLCLVCLVFFLNIKNSIWRRKLLSCEAIELRWHNIFQTEQCVLRWCPSLPWLLFSLPEQKVWMNLEQFLQACASSQEIPDSKHHMLKYTSNVCIHAKPISTILLSLH